MGNKTLITGITGNVGYHVAKHLISAGIQVKAATRNIQKAKEILGNEAKEIEFAQFDFGDESTYNNVLEDVNKVFLVRPPEIADTQKYINPFIDRAKQRGIDHIVFLSIMGADKSPIPPHSKIEKYVITSGISYTFLRSSFFMQNFNNAHLYDIKENNDIFIPAGKAKVSFIDVRDIGEVAANTLMENRHKNNAYTLTGGRALSFADAAEVFSSVLGRKITYSNPSLLKFRRTMIQRGVDKEFANVMTGLYVTTKLGLANKVTMELENILERKPRTIEDYVRDNAELWV
jgi:uncharacterized protein YbjT (DUF2867 family)